MGSLRINAILYEGKNYYYRSPRFENNLIIIEGQNGNGKSTFCKLIYHGLGGTVEEFKKVSKEQHQEIVNDLDNYIELDISINSEGYLVRRSINDNEITVTPYLMFDSEEGQGRISIRGDETEVLPINRSEKRQFTFSDWILGKLNIEVVELIYGAANFKIRFNDLFRLMFHDQSPDPSYIYKRPDSDNFISDSVMIRKVIFELLMGSVYSDYYKAVSLRRGLEKQKAASRAIFLEYESIARQLRGSVEPKNSIFIKKEMDDNDKDLERLHLSREALKKPRAVDEKFTDLQMLQSEILKNEISLGDRKKSIFDLYREKAKLIELKLITKAEVEQVAKIIHTHSQLNIFSADTCPYCLSKVDRPRDHCVCGTFVEEAQYERFFYSESEYKELLKSKQVAFGSIDLALADCERDERELAEGIHALEKKLSDAKDSISNLISEIDDVTNTHAINELDDKILDIRDKNLKLYQLLDFELKLENLEKESQKISDDLAEAKGKERSLQVNAQNDIAHKVRNFSSIYNEFMMRTLKSCWGARIDPEDYTPIINDFEYKEDSSRVHKRLMYYLTLLKMSMEESEVTAFPRFLLIDTPDTAGIDKDHLFDSIGQINELLASKDFQIILTTGVGIYPPELESYVLIRLSDDDKLLKRKSTVN